MKAEDDKMTTSQQLFQGCGHDLSKMLSLDKVMWSALLLRPMSTKLTFPKSPEPFLLRKGLPCQGKRKRKRESSHARLKYSNTLSEKAGYEALFVQNLPGGDLACL